MMRVGFGVTVLARCLQAGGVDGIGSYTRELMKRFAATPGLDLALMSYGYALPPIAGVACATMQRGRFAPSAAISAVSGLAFAGSRALAQKIDLMHATDHLMPNLGKLPVVATIMDAIPLSHPEWVNYRFKGLKNALWRRSARWTAHVITISSYSKGEIETHFRVPPEKISVIPLGVDERWFHPIAQDTIDAVLGRYGLPDKFFLFVGTLQPRKNVGRVIDAYRSLPKGITNDVPLVIVGRAGWQCDEIVGALTSHAYGESVVWLQHLPDADLLAVMKAASVLVFPSLHEGFGLPVLEAFAAGTPVITSNATALPEVAGDAALLVDPLDAASIADAMLRVIDDRQLADSLREKGYVRARAHSWDRTAAMTLDVYRQVLERRQG
jgi:glycosyltransferase involved in cell wall biosynthesis